jgi:DNA-binding CsgD family transcriptional regulator
MKSKSIRDFIEHVKLQIGEVHQPSSSSDGMKKYVLSNSDCIFTWSVLTGEMIFRSGFKKLLGIDDQILTLDRYISFIHPDDVEYVKKIGQAATLESLSRPEGNEEWMLYVAHRIRKADNSYIRILAQSFPIEFDENGRITEFLVRLNNISFTNWHGIVEYEFVHPGLDKTEFHENVFFESRNVFTAREMQIIQLIGEGKKSKEIADHLEISKHTVATHRKTIMQKSNCHSKEELLFYCKKNGIL